MVFCRILYGIFGNSNRIETLASASESRLASDRGYFAFFIQVVLTKEKFYAKIYTGEV